jgi:type I restriction enzyme M protein
VQEAVKEALYELDSEKQWMDRDVFIDEVELTFNMHGIDVRDSVYNAIERALGERNKNAEICRDSDGKPEHDTDLRERERVSLGTNVKDYFEKEIQPYMKNAWVNESSKYHDDKDGELGVVGYEIDFDSRFHEYERPRDPQEISKEIEEISQEIETLISGIASE